MADNLLDGFEDDPLLADLPSAEDPLLADLPSIPPPRAPTAREMAAPDLFSYRPPSQSILKPQPEPVMHGPEEPPAPEPYFQAPPPRPTPQQNLQALGDATIPGPMEFAGGFAKGAAQSLSMGAYRPTITRSEQAGSEMGATAASLAPLAAGPAAVPIMFAQQGLPATAGKVDVATGAPSDPAQAAIDMAFLAAMTTLPPAVGRSLLTRGLTGAGLGELQAVASQAVQDMARDGRLDLTDTEAVKEQIQNVIMGAAFGAGSRPGPARPQEAPYAGPAVDQGFMGPLRAQEPPRGMTPENTQIFAENVSRETSPAADPLLEGIPDARETMTSSQVEGRGNLFGRMDTPPDDLAADRFTQGSESRAQAALAEGDYAEAKAAHEAALRASVEADNALYEAFPDGEAPLMPALRARERELRQAMADRMVDLQGTEAALGKARTAQETTRRQAGFFTEGAEFTPAQARGRRQVAEALRAAGRSPEEIRLSLAVSDRNPQFYQQVLTEAADMTPEMRSKLFGAPRAAMPQAGAAAAAEPPARPAAAPPASAPEGSHQISFEVAFGRESPLDRAYGRVFEGLPYEQRAEVTRKVGERVVKIAKHLTGIKEGVTFFGPGGWGDYPLNPSGQVLVSPEVPKQKAMDMARIIGILAEQDGMYVSRAHPAGKNVGMDIRHETFFQDPKNVEKFWDALRKEDPELASGFYPITEEGMSGIRIGRPETWDQHEALAARFKPVLDRVADRFGLTVRFKARKLDAEPIDSPWKDNPNGTEYLRGLGGRLGSDIQERLERVYKPAVRRVVEDALPGHRQAGRRRDHGPLFQREESQGGAADGRAVGDGLARRFGVRHEDLAANTPDAAKAVYKAVGNKVEDRNTTADLKIYPLNDAPDAARKLDDWLKREGWNYKVFGPDKETGKFVPPNFKEFSYDNKHVWIFSPWTEHGSFKDTEYTRLWRVTHEVAHGQTNDDLTRKYGGVGRRQGALGRDTVFNGRPIPALSLADALRAVEWEHDTFQRQREILEKELGVTITDEQFRKENAINMSDALYRVLTGDFSNPGDLGLVPRAIPPEQLLGRVKDILREAAKDLGISQAETFGGEGLKQEADAAGDVKGAFLPADKEHKAMLYLFRGKADFSTYLHEHGHWLLENALTEGRDLAVVENWIRGELGEKAIDGKSWTTDAKEMFARGFERYLRDGQTAIPELRAIFAKIKEFMARIYTDIMNSPLRRAVPDEVRKVYDDLLGLETKRPRDGGPVLKQEGPRAATPAGARERPEGGGARGPGPQSTKPTPSRSSEKVPGERSLPKTLEANDLPGGKDREYAVKTNAQTQKRAEATILRKGLDKAAADILAHDRPSAEQTATALNIMKQWQAEADKLPEGAEKTELAEKTVALASELSRRLTNLGQAIQAVRIIERLSPDAVVLFAQKRLQQANQAARPGTKDLVLKPEQAQELREAAKEMEKARGFEADVAKIADVAARPRAKLTEADLGALKDFRDRMRAYLGETPPTPPKGAMGTGQVRHRPKAATKPKDELEAFFDAQEAAALERLGKRGRKPAKALFQTATETRLSAEEVEDFATIFASRLSRRGDRSVGAIKRNFREAFGDDLSPHLDQIAARGARILSQARSRRAKLAAIGARVNEILSPLDEDASTVHQADALRASLEEMRRLTGEAKVEAGQRLQLALQALQHPSLWRDVASAQTVAQLLNPKTQIRNLSNAVFAVLEDLRTFADTPLDMARSKLTGGPRRITFRTPDTATFADWLSGAPDRAREFGRNAAKGFRAGWQGVSPTGVDSPFDLSAQSFVGRGPVQRTLRFFRKSLGAVMTSLDYPFYERAMGQRMGQIAWLRALNEGVPADQRKAVAGKYLRQMRAGFDSMADSIEEAQNFGLYMTFQDPNVVSKALGKFKRGLNRLTGSPEFGLGDFIMKYPRIPGALLMRVLEYSPVGVGRSAMILAEPFLRRGEKPNPAEAQRALTRAIIGTAGLSGLGFILAQHGVITGRSEEDPDAKAFLKEQKGVTQYQVNASALKRWVTSGFDVEALKRKDGDELWTYDWVQPVAVSMSLGANAWKRLENEEAPWAGAMGTAFESLMGGINTLFEQPVLANLVDLFRTNKADENPLEKLPKILEGVPASFVPTILNQIRQVKDNTARDTYAPSAAQRALNKAMYKVPFLSEKLPAAYRTMGKDFPREVYQDGSNTLFNAFFNPSFVTKYKVDPLLEAIMQPYVQEGRTKQFPKRAPRKLTYTNRDGRQTLELSGEEVATLQRMMAQNVTRAFQAINLELLKGKTAEHQEKELADRVNDAWNEARSRFLQAKGIKFSH